MRTLNFIILTVLCGSVVVATLPAQAQTQPRYGSWRQEPDKLVAIIQELRALTDEADNARAADPRFLRDLRALANRYANPWKTVLIQDEFRDAQLQAGWTVDSGRFELPYGGGLRSLSVPAVETAPPPRHDNGQRKARPEDLAALLLGRILSQDGAGQDNQRDQPAAPTPAPLESQPGEIHFETAITNAFALEMKLRADTLTGNFGITLYQSKDRQTGYKLTQAANGEIHLERRDARRVTAIASATAALQLGSVQTLAWTRATDGTMIVTLDGAEVINVSDRGFQDDWRGVSLTNTGGDINISGITIKGAR
jgi:hypothetical protein